MALDPEVRKVIEELEKEIYTPLKISPTMPIIQNTNTIWDPSTRPRISPTIYTEAGRLVEETYYPGTRKALATFIDNSLFSVYEFYVTYTITITLHNDETVTVAGKGYPITYRNMKTFNKNWQLKEYLPDDSPLRGSTKFWIAVATVIYAWLTAYVFQKASVERSWVVLVWIAVNLVLTVLLAAYVYNNIERFNQFLDKHL